MKIEPIESTGITAVILGTVTWLTILIMFLVNFDLLEAKGRSNWIWIAASGFALGILGYRYTSNRAKRINKSIKPNQGDLIQDFE